MHFTQRDEWDDIFHFSLRQRVSEFVSMTAKHCIHVICSGLVKPKKYDWKDSNLALFGSDTDKQVKSEHFCF